MQETDSTYERDLTSSSIRRPLLRRLVPVLIVVFVLILIAVIVPLINVNRFQRRIVTSLSESLGRPIHLDRISLTVLPLPGLTIENLVVSEDPAFGAEPFVRASVVRATLRVSSLWRKRVEFSRIRFTDPSINLVKTNQGRWNLESILVQAARIEAAPTAQTRASAAPRFPYIEATGARLNLKLGDGLLQAKAPISLTEADLALWLSSTQEWRLRLEGRPVRTDTTVSDTGTIRMEGTLGRATSLSDIPINIKAEWRNIPLGEATRILIGRDAGLRGSMNLVANAVGTFGRSAVQTTLHIGDLRRADFLPLHPLTLDLECRAGQSGAFRSLTDLSCNWPLSDAPTQVAATGNIPDTSNLSTASFQVGTPGLQASTLIDWLHVASARIDPNISARGALTGSLVHPAVQPGDPLSQPYWQGQLNLAHGSLTLPTVSDAPIFTGNLMLRTLPPASASGSGQLVLAPISLTLGDHDFATLDARLDGTGYSLHLTGTAVPSRLLQLGTALPQIGEGLAEALPASESALRFDLVSTRPWNGEQVWHPNNRTTARSPHHN